MTLSGLVRLDDVDRALFPFALSVWEDRFDHLLDADILLRAIAFAQAEFGERFRYVNYGRLYFAEERDFVLFTLKFR